VIDCWARFCPSVPASLGVTVWLENSPHMITEPQPLELASHVFLSNFHVFPPPSWERKLSWTKKYMKTTHFTFRWLFYRLTKAFSNKSQNLPDYVVLRALAYLLSMFRLTRGIHLQNDPASNTECWNPEVRTDEWWREPHIEDISCIIR
jgi:hypothetical protein